MTALTLALVLLAAIPAPESFWPATVVGWITVVGFIGGSVVYLIDRGRREEKINGWGKRVDETAGELAHIRGVQEEHARVMAGIVAAQERITEALGEAKKSAEDCETTAERHAIELGTKVDDMRRSIEGKIGGFAERLAGVERIVVSVFLAAVSILMVLIAVLMRNWLPTAEQTRVLIGVAAVVLTMMGFDVLQFIGKRFSDASYAAAKNPTQPVSVDTPSVPPPSDAKDGDKP
jgi:hypothetical protein